MDDESNERIGELRSSYNSWCWLTFETSKLSNDPTLSSLPLLITFLKSYSWPFLGIVPAVTNKQISADVEPGSLSSTQANGDESPESLWQEEWLIGQDIRERFKRMCEGYFDSVCKKLVIEHKVFLFIVVMYISSLIHSANARTRQEEP